MRACGDGVEGVDDEPRPAGQQDGVQVDHRLRRQTVAQEQLPCGCQRMIVTASGVAGLYYVMGSFTRTLRVSIDRVLLRSPLTLIECQCIRPITRT